jgi:membrane-associated phospholipid phosphatase
MKRVCRFSFFVLISCAGLGGFSTYAWAQQADANLPDSPFPSAGPADPSSAPDRQPFDSTSEREATWRTLPRNFLRDQKDIWLFPTQLARGRHWVPTLAVAGITAGLIYADPHAMPYFRRHATNWDDFNDTFDAYITTGEVISLPVGLLAGGYARHDERTVSSALLCAEAYGDSAIVNLAMKAITRRERPVDVPVNGNYHNTFFNGGKSPFHGSSFPSGHTTGVFSVATVVANRYQRHRWVPFAAYGMAAVISASRITTAAHWPSDVFLGGALGYSIAKYETLRPR